MAIAIAIIILVLLSTVLLVGASKRRDRAATGLSKEAKQRDKSNPVLTAIFIKIAPQIGRAHV